MEGTGARRRPLRWRSELSEEELERIGRALAMPAPPRVLLKILLRSPSLIPEIATAFAASFKAALQADNVLVWLLQAERVRLIVRDAATGVAWNDERAFVEQLLPFVNPAVRALEVGCGAGRVTRHVAPHV